MNNGSILFKVTEENLDHALDTLREVLKEHAEPATDLSPAQEEAPERGVAGVSMTLIWKDVLTKYRELDVRLTALESRQHQTSEVSPKSNESFEQWLDRLKTMV